VLQIKFKDILFEKKLLEEKAKQGNNRKHVLMWSISIWGYLPF